MNTSGELIVIERQPKQGTAKLVEAAIQSVLDDPTTLDDSFAKLRASLPGQANTVQGAYFNAEKMRQVAFATAVFLTGKTALRNMAVHVQKHGTLAISDNAPFDPHTYAEYGSQTMQSYKTLRAAYHLVTAAQATMNALRDPAHPYHSFHMQFTDIVEEHQTAWTAWHEGPGANRWPDYNTSKQPGAEGALLESLCLNLQLGVSISAARAVHYLIHANSRPTMTELDAVIAETMPRALRLSSSDRHLGWSPDWQERLKRGKHVGIIPTDGALALSQDSLDKIISPNAYAASALGLPIMQDSDFCPHDILRHSSVPKAGSCGGDPWVRYADAADRQAVDDFFGEMGFAMVDSTFNFAAVALAMGRHLVKTEILPAVTLEA